MTTLAIIFGMFPSAISKSLGSEMTVPMAQVVIGGLISATILTLVVVPIGYTLLDDLKRKFMRFKNEKMRKVNVED